MRPDGDQPRLWPYANPNITWGCGIIRLFTRFCNVTIRSFSACIKSATVIQITVHTDHRYSVYRDCVHLHCVCAAMQRRSVDIELKIEQRENSRASPSRHKRWVNVGFTLVQRCRRWTNVKPTLIQCLVSAGQRHITDIILDLYYFKTRLVYSIHIPH